MAHSYGTSARLPATATTTTANPATFSINCPAGTTVLWLGIVVSTTTARSGGDPTYNGVTMSAGAAKTNAGGTAETNAETWYLLRPPTGSSLTISVPNAGGLAMTMNAACASAASGYTTVKTQASVATQGNSTNPSTTGPTGAIGDIEFSVIGNGATTWNPSGRSGTQINDWDAGSRGHGAQYRVSAGTGGSTHSWTFATSEDWIIEVDRFTESAIVAPTVTTSDPTNVGQTTCTGNGNVTADGGDTITERGVCWGTSANPTTANSKATTSGTTGAYTVDVTGLTPNTIYHFRAYAINSAGTSYGADVEALTDPYDKGWGFIPSIGLVMEVAAPAVANASSATTLSEPAGTYTHNGVIDSAASATTLSEPAGTAGGPGVVANADSATSLSTPAGQTTVYVGVVANAASAVTVDTVAISQVVVYNLWPMWMPSIGSLFGTGVASVTSATSLSTPTGSQTYVQAQPANADSATSISTIAGTLTGNGQVTLTWTASTDPSVTGYFLYWDTVSRGDSSYLLYANSRDVGNVTSYTLTGLTAGATYYLNLSAHGAGGHDAFESGLAGEVSKVAVLPTAVMSNAASATALSTPGGTQLQRGVVAAASSATTTTTPAGTLAYVGTVAAATSATSAANVMGIHTHIGVVSEATSPTLASTFSATMVYVGVPAAAVSSTIAGEPLGWQTHASTVAPASSATTASEPAGIQNHLGGAESLASTTEVSTVSGTQPGIGSVESATSAVTLSTTTSDQTCVGVVANASSAVMIDTLAGTIVAVAVLENVSSATTLDAAAGVQLQEGVSANLASDTFLTAPTGTVAYLGVVSSALTETQLSTTTSTQEHIGVVDNAASDVTASDVTIVLVDTATVDAATSDTELEEPDGRQVHNPTIDGALSAVTTSDIACTQEHFGIVAGALSETTSYPQLSPEDVVSEVTMPTILGQQIISPLTTTLTDADLLAIVTALNSAPHTLTLPKWIALR